MRLKVKLFIILIFTGIQFGVSNNIYVEDKTISQSDTEIVNDLYRSFCACYRNMKSDGVKDLYCEDAVMMGFYDNIPLQFDIGVEHIAITIEYNIEQWLAKNDSVEIEFKVLTRKYTPQYIYDSGLFKLTVKSLNGIEKNIFGKVAIVFKKGTDGNWRFFVDSNGKSSKQEFENRVALFILK